MKKFTHSRNRWSVIILNDGSTFLIKNNIRRNVLFTETDTSSNMLWTLKSKEFLSKEFSKEITYEL